MSVARIQMKRAINRFFKDSIARGIIPRLSQVPGVVAGISGRVGRPSFGALKQPVRSISNTDDHNTNINLLVEDLSDITVEMINQQVHIDSFLTASDTEYMKLIRKASDLRAKISDTLDGEITGQLKFRDSFDTLRYIDTTRTSAHMNVVSGTATTGLPIENSNMLPVPLRADWGTPNIRPTHSVSTISGFPNMEYSELFETDGVWALQVQRRKLPFTSDAGGFRFDVQLVPDGEEGIVPKQISLEGQGMLCSHTYIPGLRWTAHITVRYKDDEDGKWKIYDAIENDSEVAGHSLEWNNPTFDKKVKMLSFTLIKHSPDTIGPGARKLYRFRLRRLVIHAPLIDITYPSRAELYSKSIPLQVTGNLPSTINKVSLSTIKSLPSQTNIDFYVAPDRYLDGYFYASGEYAEPGHAGIDEFLPIPITGTPPHVSGALQSELREWAYTSPTGWFWDDIDYRDWDPEWVKIRDGDGAPMDPSGYSASDGVIFNTVSTMAGVSLDGRWGDSSGFPDFIDNGIDFYRVFNFYEQPIGTTLTVRQGKNTWRHTVGIDYLARTITASGTVDDVPTYTIGPYPSQAQIGTIVVGSVRRVAPVTRHPASDPSDQGYYQGVGPNPQYFVTYTNANITITRNPLVAGDEIPVDQEISFELTYKDPVRVNQWVTHYYLPGTSSMSITMDPGGTTSRRIRMFDGASRVMQETEIPYSGLKTITGPGWVEVTIDVQGGYNWDPLTSFTITKGEPKQYAWMQPLRLLSEFALTDNVHRDDHTNCAIIWTDSGAFGQDSTGDFQTAKVWLAVNDPTTPPSGGSSQTYTELRNPNLMDGAMLTGSGIFASGDAIKEFYDLEFTAIAEVLDHVILKANLNSSIPGAKPVLHEYTLSSEAR